MCNASMFSVVQGLHQTLRQTDITTCSIAFTFSERVHLTVSLTSSSNLPGQVSRPDQKFQKENSILTAGLLNTLPQYPF